MLISHFIANAIEHKYKLVITNFSDYIEYFETEDIKSLRKLNITLLDNTLGNQIQRIFYRILISFIYRFFNSRIVRSTPTSNSDGNVEYLLDNPEFLSLVKERIVVCEGFAFRDFKAVNKHLPVIKQIFKPKSIYLENAVKLVSGLREKFDIVIGVHIRKSDYKIFEKGKFYFENEVYYNNMNKLMEELLAKQQSCTFILCSDENIHLGDFSTLSIVGTSKIIIEDMVTLSECDFIIGPPSTFSQWASFYGETPLGIIYNRNQVLNLLDYKVFTI